MGALVSPTQTVWSFRKMRPLGPLVSPQTHEPCGASAHVCGEAMGPVFPPAQTPWSDGTFTEALLGL